MDFNGKSIIIFQDMIFDASQRAINPMADGEMQDTGEVVLMNPRTLSTLSMEDIKASKGVFIYGAEEDTPC